MKIKEWIQANKTVLSVLVVLLFAWFLFARPVAQFQNEGANYKSAGFAAVDSVASFAESSPSLRSDGYYDEGSLVHYSAYLSLEEQSKYYQGTKAQIETAISRYTIEVQSSSEDLSRYSNTRSWYLQAQVASNELQALLDELQELGEVVSVSVNSYDQEEYYGNTQEQLDSLRAIKTRMQELLAQAEDFSDIIQLEERILDLNRQIEYFESRQSDIQEQVEYADITIRLQETRTGFAAIGSQFSSIGELIEAVVLSFDSLLRILSQYFAYIVVLILGCFGYKTYQKRSLSKTSSSKRR